MTEMAFVTLAIPVVAVWSVPATCAQEAGPLEALAVVLGLHFPN